MDTREKILETAMRLFSTHGYGNTSLSQIAKEASVSKALIFWHFESKEKLFRTAIQRTLEPYFINVLDDLEGLSEVAQVKRLIDEYYAFVSKNIYSVKFFLGLILREQTHPDDVVRRMNELQRPARQHHRERAAKGTPARRREAVPRRRAHPERPPRAARPGVHGARCHGAARSPPPAPPSPPG